MTANDIVLITGANKGIGFAAARHLAAAGLTVLLGARDPGRGHAAVTALAEEGHTARFVHLDVTDQSTVDAAATEIEGAYGRLDILINNAGISRDRDHSPSTMPATALREVYDTNVFGVVTVTNAMLPLLRRSAHGHVGNVSSGLGTMALLADPAEPLGRAGRLLAYNSSKAALNAVTLMYAHELRAAGIRVNALSPGHCATDLNNHTGALPADTGGRYLAEQVLRAGEPSGVFLNENGGAYRW